MFPNDHRAAKAVQAHRYHAASRRPKHARPPDAGRDPRRRRRDQRPGSVK